MLKVKSTDMGDHRKEYKHELESFISFARKVSFDFATGDIKNILNDWAEEVEIRKEAGLFFSTKKKRDMFIQIMISGTIKAKGIDNAS